MTKEEQAVVKSCVSCGFATKELALNITQRDYINYENLKYWRRVVNVYAKKLSADVSLLLKNKKEDSKK